MTTPYHASVRQGIDWIFDITASSGGVVIDLTGYAISLEARSFTDIETIILSVGNGITVATPTNGKAIFRVTAAQTLLIPVGMYNFSVKATASGAGAIATEWVVGTLNVLKELA